MGSSHHAHGNNNIHSYMPIKKEELKEEKLFKVYIYAFYLYTKTSSYKYPKSIMNA